MDRDEVEDYGPCDCGALPGPHPWDADIEGHHGHGLCVIYTTAPASYDYGTLILDEWDTAYTYKGARLRRVLVRHPDDAKYQTVRYWTGSYPAVPLFADLLGLELVHDDDVRNWS